jgi:hypothetical protein
MQKEYWMVLGAGRPNYQHTKEQSAIDEAERLALLHPGSAFTVLKAVCTIRSNLQVSTVKYGRPEPLPSWLEQPKPSITIHTTDDDIANYLNRAEPDDGMPF